jgi:hypothetical protein
LVAVRRVQQPGGELFAGCRVQARPEHRSLHGEQVGTSVAVPDPSDPYDFRLLDPDPSDPNDLGLLDPEPLVRGSGSGSFCHQAKIVRKTLIPRYCFVTSF